MPPALHPRSRWTTSLFTSTLLVSFLVVGTPHILPCPAPRNIAADSRDLTDPSRPRRRRKRASGASEDPEVQSKEVEPGRECPVPKPSGLVGQILGFKERKENTENPTIIIESTRTKERRKAMDEKTDQNR
ncbi:hypothetical protein EJ05DRAFT_490462 [Pseudovirgaria hyperparasitica]|uniref:Alpha-1,3-mannosyltransferase n=1 Tax=Pseudovirgaria hyperparasitica TaxID=470096 RepID=A0A6A6VTD6_9PEZI|nr:uncharacterized protein EJ05DRAFT_490462 [Pseudovirgaria hyperparasitica]KAF2753056.1 hypothetical protein EJ05DRAFT_490462 [Pseudovirgaria hyperparasitica]